MNMNANIEKAQKEAEKIMVSVVTVLGFAFAFVDAWMTMALYKWFAVPLGAPMLGYWHVLGLMALRGLVLPGRIQPTPAHLSDANWSSTILSGIVARLMAAGVLGAVAYLGMY